MESIKITSIKNTNSKILAIQLLRHHIRTNKKSVGLLGLPEAKAIVDAMHLGHFCSPRLYVFNDLTPEFEAMFEFEKTPVLKLYKVRIELDSTPVQEHDVIILSIGANTARHQAMTHLTAKHGFTGYVRNVTEITEFKRNTILASYKVS